MNGLILHLILYLCQVILCVNNREHNQLEYSNVAIQDIHLHVLASQNLWDTSDLLHYKYDKYNVKLQYYNMK